jgi:hypothetical protein
MASRSSKAQVAKRPAARATSSGASAAPAASSSSEQSYSESNSDARCERCSSLEVTDYENPLVYCSKSPCETALHLHCFKTFVKPPAPLTPELVATESFQNYCSAHLDAAIKHYDRDHPNEGDADEKVLDSKRQIHNLPKIFAPVDDKMPASGKGTAQIYMAAPHSAEALKYNARQLGLEVKDSTTGAHGRALFATKDIAVGATVGHFYGIFVKETWFQTAKRDTPEPLLPLFPYCNFAHEDFGLPVWDGSWRAVDIEFMLLPGAKRDDSTVLLVSEQCPMTFANDPRDASKCNVEMKMPEMEPFEPEENQLDATMIKLVCTKSIKKGEEILLDYGWPNQIWKNMEAQVESAKQRVLDDAYWRKSATEHLYEWAAAYEKFPKISRTDRDGLVEWLCDFREVIVKPKNKAELIQNYESSLGEGKVTHQQPAAKTPAAATTSAAKAAGAKATATKTTAAKATAAKPAGAKATAAKPAGAKATAAEPAAAKATAAKPAGAKATAAKPAAAGTPAAGTPAAGAGGAVASVGFSDVADHPNSQIAAIAAGAYDAVLFPGTLPVVKTGIWEIAYDYGEEQRSETKVPAAMKWKLMDGTVGNTVENPTLVARFGYDDEEKIALSMTGCEGSPLLGQRH